MRLEHDDPRLMDYVLGELEDGEALELAAALKEEENAEARVIVEELRGVAETTRRILLEDEDKPALSDEQRAAIVGQAEQSPDNVVPMPTPRSFRRSLDGILAVAAIITVVVGLSIFVQLRGKLGLPNSPMALNVPAEEKSLSGDSYGYSVSGKRITALESAIEGERAAAAPAKPLRPGLEVHDMSITYSTNNLYSKDSKSGEDGRNVAMTDVGGDQYGIPGNGGFDPLVGLANEETTITAGQEIPFITGSSTPATIPSASGDEAPMVEARNRLNINANINNGLTLTYESDKGDVEMKAEVMPEEEHWAEYNVGNLTGQQELPELTASNMPGDEQDDLPVAEFSRPRWQWNSPDPKNTQIVGGPGSETYVKVAGVKPFIETKAEPLSTFSIDVDTAAYSNVRRFLTNGQMPPQDAVRIEEMINYFDYDYPQPTDHHPFAMVLNGAPAPWDQNHRLVRVGIKGKEVSTEERPPANLVFLLDVSGSMGGANKLPLVKESMKTLLSQLTPRDKVGIVTYAGDARKVLDLTPCSESATIIQAIDSLRAGGGTNGGGGIEMAYNMAQAAYNVEGINRVIMATDGDFNVGNTTHGGLMGLIENRAKSGVFLTTLGFGMGNLKDSTLEQLADRGNGNYAYIDTHAEARKALGKQLTGTLYTIAKDVKIQVEFNPNRVSHYRLLGYENRALANQDFNDDTKDAGEIGAGHTITALYEIIPRGAIPVPGVDPLKYSETGVAPEVDRPEPDPSGEWLTVKMRYKQPTGNESTKLEMPLNTINNDLSETDADFRFASAVAAFGQVLRNPGYRHPSNFDRILDLARPVTGGDSEKEAFLDLVVTAKTLSPAR